MGEKYSIIVVDDDAALSRLMKHYFIGAGHVCEAFSNAESALERIAGTTFDVLVTDIVLPGMKGLELAERAHRVRPEMSIIVTTGFIDDFSYDAAVAAGAADFIKKPFTLNELMIRIKHVLLLERLRRMSITDELTGLPNRRGFFVLAEQQLRTAQRSKENLVLLFADLDGFKTINDTLGHQAGDEALCSMASLFRRSYRKSDIIARMGGDEFAILLVDPTDHGVKAAQKRLQKNLDRFNDRENAAYQLKVSIGMATLDLPGQNSIDTLLRRADERMYAEKEQSRKNGVHQS
jgi:two-component system, cell cycle response regulator